MRVGTIAYATEQGLGRLAKAFYDNGVVTHVLVLKHHCRQNHYEWYPGASVVTSDTLKSNLAQDFIRGLDVLLLFETPFSWKLMQYAKDRRVRTVLMPMYECTPATLPVQPDYFIFPSQLDEYYFPDKRGTFIPVPVDVPWKLRQRAEVFVHNAGHGGLKGRNGTAELLEAMQYVTNPDITLILRSQAPLESPKDPRITCHCGTLPYKWLWEQGDVFVFPEKFNGLSLPLQEAYASGMLVMGSNRFPMNTWLPQHPLIPVAAYRKDRIGGCIPFQSAVINPRDIATWMDRWAGRDIMDYSLQGKAWAEQHSWSILKPKYLEALQCA